MATATLGLVFNFDGPIFDGHTLARRALLETGAHFASEFEQRLPEDELPHLDAEHSVAIAYPMLDKPAREKILRLYRAKLREVESATEASEKRSVFDSLLRSGLKLAVFSWRPADEARDLLRKLGLEDTFQAKEFDLRQSDQRLEGLQRIAASLDLRMVQLVLIGHLDRDCALAKAAKVGAYYHAGWTRSSCTVAAKKATLTLESLDELLHIARSDGHSSSAPSPMDRVVAPEIIDQGHFCFYAGAGISIDSGFGNWSEHYHPIIQKIGGSFLETRDLPEALQLLSAWNGREVFDLFKESFVRPAKANPYHHAILRSGAQRVWTSNYDLMFEQANVVDAMSYRVARNDTDLQKHFRDRLIVKMNGDFEDAAFSESLDWGLVFLQDQFDRSEAVRSEIWRLFEDDYRNLRIFFVGCSFRDPALRRVVSLARRKILRTRYEHCLFALRAKHPAGRAEQAMFAENLKRVSIQTVFRDSPSEILEAVQRIALKSARPIVGISGSTGKVEAGGPDRVPAGLTMSCRRIEEICAALGKRLADQGFWVTSGGAPHVGRAAVDAAYLVEPTRARVYLRMKKEPSTSYRTSPAVIVKGDYAQMRQRFISELSCLVVVAGLPHDGSSDGVQLEIDMALQSNIPIVVLPQAGGTAARFMSSQRCRIELAYSDPELRSAVCALNDCIASVRADDLPGFVDRSLVQKIEELLLTSMGSSAAPKGRAKATNGDRW